MIRTLVISALGPISVARIWKIQTEFKQSSAVLRAEGVGAMRRRN